MRKPASVALLASLVLVILPGASPAEADTPAATRYFCLYEHDDFKGGKWCITEGGYKEQKKDPSLSNNYWAGTSRPVNNGTSSVKNGTNCLVWLYDANSYGGDSYYSDGRSEDSDVTNNHFDNKASSLHMDCS
ncbi:peptidase inhibitor family I36 protein [Nonomuraea sp. NEAU-A123]|uniref:peptidase inhibitor family I36 protein n=1 Tax=Nonomuraea sp. NEAU-A123 TaxID=2839649 RepID=UPI001BE4515C|nr:peptidase inhibitor family I36 protein [Nonomuraea sp. NEAU-A123]MBT2232211.1 peptidase inhibitor family I36 protein [Nonomuraea sp. NEAU-A123]